MTEAEFAPTEIYLVIEAGPTATDRIATALRTIEAASVLIVPPPGATLDAAAARPLVEAVQAADAAALILDDASLARALRADGVHLGLSDAIAARYEDARDILGTRYIVGAHAGKSRHDAMHLGEAGAEYVAFGAPTAAKDQDAARQRRRELVAWWAEIFEIPCVAMDVETPEDARELAAAGADFVAVTVPAAVSVEAQAEFLRAIADAARIGSEARAP